MEENKISLKGDNIHINMDNGSIVDIAISITSNATIPYAIYIYDLITGYVERRNIYDKPRIELHSRGVLSELEKHYPCVKRIDRRGMPNIQIYPKNVDVYYEEDKDTIIITVKYSDKYNPLDLLTSDRSVWSNRSKLCDLLQNLFHINSAHDNATDKELNNKGDNNMKYPETAYISSDIEIRLKKRVINDITVYIPLHVKASDAVKIYDEITGHGELRPYEMLDALKEYYPYIKNIDRGEIDNDYIFTQDIGVFYEDTRVRIVVEYSKYSKSVACHIDDKRIDLINIFSNIKKGGNIAEDRLYYWRNINIHVIDGVIDYMKLYIPSDSDQISIYDIYDIITGYIPDNELINEERSVIVDTKKAIKKMHFYDLLDELKKYYPSLKQIHRTEIYNSPIYPKDIDVCGKDKIIAITVKYGYTTTSFSIPNLSEIYSSISSGRSKLFDHLCCISDNSNKKLKELKELKKKINSVFGVPTFEAFDAITDELKDTYIKKNHDYGNSFDKSIDKFGLTAAVVRMSDKMERLSSLLNKDAKVDESIRDTVMDLANYCIMTAMYLDKKEKNK